MKNPVTLKQIMKGRGGLKDLLSTLQKGQLKKVFGIKPENIKLTEDNIFTFVAYAEKLTQFCDAALVILAHELAWSNFIPTKIFKEFRAHKTVIWDKYMKAKDANINNLNKEIKDIIVQYGSRNLKLCKNSIILYPQSTPDNLFIENDRAYCTAIGMLFVSEVLPHITLPKRKKGKK